MTALWRALAVLLVLVAPASSISLDGATSELISCSQGRQPSSAFISVQCRPKERPNTMITFASTDRAESSVSCTKEDRPQSSLYRLVHCRHGQGYFIFSLHTGGGISIQTVGLRGTVTVNGSNIGINGGTMRIVNVHGSGISVMANNSPSSETLPMIIPLDPETSKLITCSQSKQRYSSFISIKCSPNERPNSVISFSISVNDTKPPFNCSKQDYMHGSVYRSVHCQHKQGYFDFSLHTGGGISLRTSDGGGSSLVVGGNVYIGGGNLGIENGVHSNGGVIINGRSNTPANSIHIGNAANANSGGSDSNGEHAKKSVLKEGERRYIARSPSGAAVFETIIDGNTVHVVVSASGASVITVNVGGRKLQHIRSASGNTVINGQLPGVNMTGFFGNILRKLN